MLFCVPPDGGAKVCAYEYSKNHCIRHTVRTLGEFRIRRGVKVAVVYGGRNPQDGSLRIARSFSVPISPIHSQRKTAPSRCNFWPSFCQSHRISSSLNLGTGYSAFTEVGEQWVD